MKNQKILISLLIVGVLTLPIMAFAQPKQIGSLDQIIQRLEVAVWQVFGLIAVIAFITAGILFLTAGGVPEKVQAARSSFLWGVAGVVIGILAYSIIAIVQQIL